MRQIKIYDKNTLDSSTIISIHNLIVTSFLRRWGIYRNDVTLGFIKSRLCAVAFDDNQIIGYAGLEDSGEFVNGCAVENVNGIYLLASLVKKLLQYSGKQGYLYFAHSPKIDKAIPLTAYIATNGYLSITNEVIKKKYNSKIIVLHRINFFSENKISKNDLLNKLNNIES